MGERAETDALREAIEATRLSFGQSRPRIEAFTREALVLGVRGVCVPVAFLSVVREVVREGGGARLDVVGVANFPLGDHSLAVVLAQAEEAITAGADHLDVVVPGGLVAERDWTGVARYLGSVRRRLEEGGDRGVSMKVILEIAAFDSDRIGNAARAAIDAGAAWLKTSTGFHPRGGATLDAVRRLREIAPGEVGIKASGGIRTRQDALDYLNAGADRIGTSSEGAILGGRTEEGER